MPNRLADESSPYLRQHAGNPVDWYPWGPEALARAKAEDKPILLSIGYSACHWCHVMDHESFSDAATAERMNRDFVNIKVDREERPDLDEVYMQAVQAFTGGHGGWPMTVFLRPDGVPFLGGTYFPPEPSGRMPSFGQVMDRAVTLWRDRRDDLGKVAEQVKDILINATRAPSAGPALSDDALDRVLVDAARTHDPVDGGFGPAPKFPPHGTLSALLAHHARTGDARSLGLVTSTLDAMIRGGMWDHLAGGFARYSVDKQWLIPHFEKMLYDQAQLVPVYVDAWRHTGNPTYARIARQTLDFVLRDMTSPEGAFWSAYDADSEGVEGRFYAWTPAQLREVLGIADGTRVAALCGVSDAGNFEHGASVITLDQPLEAQEERELLERAFPKLLAARNQRVWPGLDDKVVTAWNGLLISALCTASQAFDDAGYAAAAARAARHILDHARPGGRLHRITKGGKATIPGYLDDHAALTGALLDLYETTFEIGWLREAEALADATIALFGSDDGPLYFTGIDGEELVVRSRKLVGGAEPSGNGLAASAFNRLEALRGRTDLGERAEDILLAFQPLLERAPRAVGAESVAIAWRTGVTQEIGIVGSSEAARALISVVRSKPRPFAVVARVDPDAIPAELPWMEGRFAADGQPTAWVCEAHACQLPTTDPAELAAQITPRPAENRAATDEPRVRAPALPARAEDWVNSAPIALESLRGHVLILDFWTFCCINCMHVLPELAAVEERFAGQPVVVVGVHSAKFTAEQERDNVSRAVARYGVKHPVVNDPAHDLWSRYAVRSWPTIVVVDAEGKVAWTRPGEATREEIGAVVQRLLDEARAKGILATPMAPELAPVEAGGELRFPGKVSMWPSPADQEEGANPFGTGARLYVADSGHHRILEAGVSRGPDGWPLLTRLRTFGGGGPGFEDGFDPQFRGPQGVSRAGDTLWVADTENHAIRAIDLESGEVRTVAGTGTLGRTAAVDPGAPRKADLRSPWDVAAAADVVFVAMAGTHQVWVYLPDQDRIGPFVGSGREAHVDGSPEQAALAQPSGIAHWGRYLLWVDSETSSVRVMDLQERTVHTVVGQGLFDFGDVDGPADQVLLQHPLGLTVARGEIWVADTYNGKIKAIALDGARTRTVASGLSEPGGVTVAGDFLIVADTGNHRLVAIQARTGEMRALDL